LNSSNTLASFTLAKSNGEKHHLRSEPNYGGDNEITLQMLLNNSFEEQTCCQGARVDVDGTSKRQEQGARSR